MGLKISIIVPVYNAEKQLHHCLDSILNQKYKFIELILINDGSTDRSGKICDEYAYKDNRIKVIHQRNQGPSKARNVGISVATGDYIQFVDSDDTIEINMTSKMVDDINDNVDLVICGYKSVNKSGSKTIIKEYSTTLNGTYCKNDFLSNLGYLISQGLVNSPCNKIYSSRIINKFNLSFDESINMGEDLLFNLMYFNYCEKVKISNECLYNYLLFNENSLTINYKSGFFENQIFLYNKIKEFLLENNCYKEKNKYFIELGYVFNIVYCLDNLFHGNSSLDKTQRKKEIHKIVNDEWLLESLGYFKYSDNLQTRIIGFFVKHKYINCIYLFLKLKNSLRNNAKLFALFKQLNKK